MVGAPQTQSHFVLKSNDTPVTILLVDDDADCRMLLRDAISESKVINDVREVCNGLEAIEFLNRTDKRSVSRSALAGFSATRGDGLRDEIHVDHLSHRCHV